MTDWMHEIAKSMHYPQCWDTSAYPTLEHAIYEMASCSECKPKETHQPVTNVEVPTAKQAEDLRRCVAKTEQPVGLTEYLAKELFELEWENFDGKPPLWEDDRGHWSGVVSDILSRAPKPESAQPEELRKVIRQIIWNDESVDDITDQIMTAVSPYLSPKRESGTHRLVIIESPYAGDIEANVEYARKCVRDSLLRGEAPIASHLLYTQPGILRDEVPEERQHGIDAGLAWRRVASASVVYTDMGISKGMEYGIKAAEAEGISVEYRSIE